MIMIMNPINCNCTLVCNGDPIPFQVMIMIRQDIAMEINYNVYKVDAYTVYNGGSGRCGPSNIEGMVLDRSRYYISNMMVE